MEKHKFVDAPGLKAGLSSFLREIAKLFVVRVDGKDLSSNDYTDEEKEKLSKITENATKTEKSAINGNILINGKEETVYTLPTASQTEKGGIIVGEGLQVDASGKLNVTSVSLANDHAQLINRDAKDQHPISAITNLTQELNNASTRPMTSEEILQIIK